MIEMNGNMSATSPLNIRPFLTGYPFQGEDMLHLIFFCCMLILIFPACTRFELSLSSYHPIFAQLTLSFLLH
jgi:hypothetical protein